MHPKRLRRVKGFSYSGPYRYFLTICAHDRKPLFENRELADCVRTQLLQSAINTGYIVIAYCIMPEHLHALIEGDERSSPLSDYVKRAKQASGYHGRRIIKRPVWQTGYFERVLRSSEDTRTVVAYLLNNPVRRKLVEDPGNYPFSGSGVCELKELFDLVQLPSLD